MVREEVEVGLEVGTAALFARLDQHNATTVGNLVCLKRLYREQGTEGRVAVVGDAASEDTVAAAYGNEGIETLGPVPERRLLVEVTVEHGGTRARGRRLDGHAQHRRAVLQTVDHHVE